MDHTQSLLAFIQKSVSCYHAVAAITKRLEEEGFCRLTEQTCWTLREGGSYYVTRNESSVIAFRIPQKNYPGYQIVASHCDSPTFRLKENMNMENGHYVKLNVEKYGGMICSTWFDRPLSVAGRIVVRTKEGAESRLFDMDRDLVMIPNLAIHMNRDVNDGHKYNIQNEMMPVLGMEGADFKKLIVQKAGTAVEDLLGADLFLYNRERGSIWGASEEFCSSPKLDDLQCAYASLEGFLAATGSENVGVYAVFDNEEVGSTTKQGAASTFLKDVLKRINRVLGRSEEDYCTAIANSLMLSADNAHGLHPNYADKSDAGNRPFLNGGIVIKYNAAQKYTTDAVSAAALKLICERADVPYQFFANRSDMAGGSTLGNISNTQVSLDTADIGLAQWAMHSAYETAGAKDTEYFFRMAKEFYSATLYKSYENGQKLYWK